MLRRGRRQAAARSRSPRPRRLHAHHDGRRRDAVAPPSHARCLRPFGRDAARLRRTAGTGSRNTRRGRVMIVWGAAMAAVLLWGPAGAAGTETSYADAGGGRVLRESVVVPAPRAAVWAAFTTDAVFAKWAELPVAQITTGNGGVIEFGLMPGAKIGDPMNVKNRIDVFLPDELLVFHN